MIARIGGSDVADEAALRCSRPGVTLRRGEWLEAAVDQGEQVEETAGSAGDHVADAALSPGDHIGNAEQSSADVNRLR